MRVQTSNPRLVAADSCGVRVQIVRGLRILVFFALIVTIAGCAENGSVTASAKVVNVEVGMTQKQVLDIMGPPQRREIHGGTEFLIYPAGGASEGAVANFVPIAIVDGRVTGIGRSLYDTVVHAKAQVDQSANTSR